MVYSYQLILIYFIYLENITQWCWVTNPDTLTCEKKINTTYATVQEEKQIKNKVHVNYKLAIFTVLMIPNISTGLQLLFLLVY